MSMQHSRGNDDASPLCSTSAPLIVMDEEELGENDESWEMLRGEDEGRETHSMREQEEEQQQPCLQQGEELHESSAPSKAWAESHQPEVSRSNSVPDLDDLDE